MERSRTTFSSLPIEVHMMIFSELIPSDETFRLITRKPYNAEVHFPRHHAHGVRWLDVPQTKIETPVEVDSALPVEILPYLLIHPSLYPTILRTIYSENTFSFPDVHTAEWFARHISPSARRQIRSVHIDACGAMYQKLRSASLRMYRFEHAPDPAIVEVPKLFPGLHEMRIAGIGPGIVRDMNQEDGLAEYGFGHNEVMEDRNLWDLACIKLVARIIGLVKLWNDTDNKHVLNGGRVIGERVRKHDRFSKNYGAYQVLGIRIVPAMNIGMGLNMDEEEEEVDVSAVLKQSQWFQDSRPKQIIPDDERIIESETLQRRIDAQSHRKSGSQRSSWGTWLLDSLGYGGASQADGVKKQASQRQWYGNA